MSTITTLPSRAHMHHPIALLMGILCNTGCVHPDEHRLRLNNQAVGKKGVTCRYQTSLVPGWWALIEMVTVTVTTVEASIVVTSTTSAHVVDAGTTTGVTVGGSGVTASP
jgi:hypothetical protein